MQVVACYHLYYYYISHIAKDERKKEKPQKFTTSICSVYENYRVNRIKHSACLAKHLSVKSYVAKSNAEITSQQPFLFRQRSDRCQHFSPNDLRTASTRAERNKRSAHYQNTYRMKKIAPKPTAKGSHEHFQQEKLAQSSKDNHKRKKERNKQKFR